MPSPSKKNETIKNILSKIESSQRRGFFQTTSKEIVTKDDQAYSETLLDWFRADRALRSALETKHESIMRIGYTFYGDQAIPKNLKYLNKTLRFNKWFRDQLWHYLIWRNTFTELGKDSKDYTSRLNIVLPTSMEIGHDVHGIVDKYIQYQQNPVDGQPQFIVLPEDRIVHLATHQFDTSLWGESEIGLGVRLMRSKRLIEDYIKWMFETNQFRPTIKIPGTIKQTDVDMYMQMLKNGMRNPLNWLVLQGDEAEHGVLRSYEGMVELLAIAQYFTSEIISLFKLPPIKDGDTGTSNRSSGEYQVRHGYDNHIYALMVALADEINNEFFPKLGFDELYIRPNIVDTKLMNDILDVAIKLSQVGANRKKLNQWIIQRGLDIPEDLLEEPMIPGAQEPGLNKNGTLSLDKNSPLQPSRKPKQMGFEGEMKLEGKNEP